MPYARTRSWPSDTREQPRSLAAHLRLEVLEDRTNPYVLSGASWANSNLSFSFIPDGTAAEGSTSTLFSLLNATAPTATWQREVARALQSWAEVSRLNFRLVTDPGDIRVGAVPQDGSLAYAYYPSNGDTFLNPAYQFPVGSGYDLYSVLLHEFGHSLGIRHSDVAESVMAPSYQGVRDGLLPDDIAAIRAIYSARQADAYDAAAANDSLATATALTLAAGGLNFTADLTSRSDVDFYRVTASGSALTISLDARNRSLLAPKILVYDRSGNLVGSASAEYGQVAILSLTRLAVGQPYYLAADGATADALGAGSYALTAQFSGDPTVTPPTAPGGLAAAAVGPIQVNLAWQDNSTDEDGFRVERSADGVNFTLVANTPANATGYSVTGLSAATTYYFRVRAFNAAGDSAWSNTAQATTPDVPPAAPTNLAAATASSSQVNLAWADNASNEGGFRVEVSADGATFTLLANASANATAYAATGLSANTTYHFRVRAFNAAGNSAWSNTAQATTAGSTAVFGGSDTTTQGSWVGQYGADGYTVVGGGTSLPAYAQVSPAGHSDWTWAASTADARALQKPGAADRVAACWYGQTFSVDVRVTDGQAHPVSLYFVDWDRHGRAQRVEVLDGETGAVLDSRDVTAFGNGTYLTWSVSGHVTFRVTSLAGPNAVLSGVFFGMQPTPPQGNTAVFGGSDTTTQGSWVGQYGADGYTVVGGGTSLPAYAQVSPAGHSDWTWAASTAEVRALQKPGAADRVAACWYGQTFTVGVTLTDGRTHRVSLYFVDWDRHGRAQKVEVLDGETGAVLDSRDVTAFGNGTYLSWNLTGRVAFRITVTAGPNAVLSGLFFDTPVGGLLAGGSDLSHVRHAYFADGSCEDHDDHDYDEHSRPAAATSSPLLVPSSCLAGVTLEGLARFGEGQVAPELGVMLFAGPRSSWRAGLLEEVSALDSGPAGQSTVLGAAESTGEAPTLATDFLPIQDESLPF